ncbi:MAG: hypothetical protein KAW92_10595 [Candidatus Cloacimonetes bacterium]|nr:hypothetical protein [Candidatus Cloacimonadota bacterium]
MIKDNKVLKALERIRERIEKEVVTLKRSDEKYEIEFYDAKGVNKVLQEEINKAIREGE